MSKDFCQSLKRGHGSRVVCVFLCRVRVKCHVNGVRTRRVCFLPARFATRGELIHHVVSLCLVPCMCA